MAEAMIDGNDSLYKVGDVTHNSQRSNCYFHSLPLALLNFESHESSFNNESANYIQDSTLLKTTSNDSVYESASYLQDSKLLKTTSNDSVYESANYLQDSKLLKTTSNDSVYESGMSTICNDPSENLQFYMAPRPSGCKDRHRKVITAKGLRDRRIRLGVQTAIKLFHVQDILGFKQPGQAIEWLMQRCHLAIQEIPGQEQLTSQYTSKLGAESPSAVQSTITTACNDPEVKRGSSTKERRKCQGGAKPRRPRITEDSRAKARERARERALKRAQLTLTNDPSVPFYSQIEPANCGSWSTCANGALSQSDVIQQYDFNTLVHQTTSDLNEAVAFLPL